MQLVGRRRRHAGTRSSRRRSAGPRWSSDSASAPSKVVDVLALAGDTVGQRAGRARHRRQDRGPAHHRIWRSRHAAGARRRDQAAEAAPDADGECREGAHARASWSGCATTCRCTDAARRLRRRRGAGPREACWPSWRAGVQASLARSSQPAGAGRGGPPDGARARRRAAPRRADRADLRAGAATRGRCERWIAAAARTGCVAVDTETTSLDPMRAELVGICLAVEPGQACYIPVGHTTRRPQGTLDLDLDGAANGAARRSAARSAGRAIGCQADARGPGHPQDRPQHQVRHAGAAPATASRWRRSTTRCCCPTCSTAAAARPRHGRAGASVHLGHDLHHLRGRDAARGASAIGFAEVRSRRRATMPPRTRT